MTVLISQLGASRRNRGDHESTKLVSAPSASVSASVPALNSCCGSTPFDVPLACGSNRLIEFLCEADCKSLLGGGGGGGGGGGTAGAESTVRGGPGGGGTGGAGGSEFRSFELVKPVESREEK